MATTKKFTLMSQEEAFKLADKIGRTGKTLNQDVQRIAVTAICYANIHGDVTIAQRIWETIQGNKGIRLNSFVRYLEVFGMLKFSKEDNTFKYARNDDAETDPGELIVELSTNSWYEAIKQEEVASTYDVEEMVRKLIKTIETKAKANVGHNMLNMDKLEALKQVVYTAVKFEEAPTTTELPDLKAA